MFTLFGLDFQTQTLGELDSLLCVLSTKQTYYNNRCLHFNYMTVVTLYCIFYITARQESENSATESLCKFFQIDKIQFHKIKMQNF